VPPQSWDGTIAAQKLLSAVYRLKHERGRQFGAGHVIDILLGRQTPRVLQQRHDTLTVFGVGTELREAEWRGVVRQLLAQGLLTVEGEYGTLALTAASTGVLRKQHQVLLRREPEPEPRARRGGTAGTARNGGAAAAAAAAELTGEAKAVFERLRTWRAATAKQQGVPAYVIFHDATLREIATARPASLAGLSRVTGVGENKLAKYGQQILDTLRN
jgi:ATP-dependent DNA helicase RecQ